MNQSPSREMTSESTSIVGRDFREYDMTNPQIAGMRIML